ncbi:hypothetical protein OSB04_031879 [Centaurea solstitialis]|uniref:DUF8039 domain-containing protein n=1 Tax=Centaurea solstitialis TaxID=347529 RepID=A0AA38SNI9_9ASTR|nr:hypothetical protein OSB04_031879 [Centaurea solstitialis]
MIESLCDALKLECPTKNTSRVVHTTRPRIPPDASPPSYYHLDFIDQDMSNQIETSFEDSYGSPPSNTDGISHGTQPQQQRHKRSVTLLKKKKRREDLQLEFDKYGGTCRNPCDVYPYLDQKAWEEFCVKKTTKEFLAHVAIVQCKARVEGKDPGELSQLFGLKDPRARDFLLTRRVKTTDGRKIIKFHKVFGSLGPGEDVLTSVLGQHPGRTRAVGHAVGLRQTIGGNYGLKRKCRIQEDIDWEQKKVDMDAMYKEKVRLIDEKNKLVDAKLDMLKQMKSKNDDIHDGSPSFETGKSTYGSVPYFDEFDDVQLLAPCDLLVVDGDYKFPCAKGMLHSIGDGLCHPVPMKENYVKVHVDQVNKIFANFLLPMLKEEMKELGDARNSFIQGPRKAIFLIQGTRKKPTPKKQRTHVKNVILVQTLSKRPTKLQALYKRWESR